MEQTEIREIIEKEIRKNMSKIYVVQALGKDDTLLFALTIDTNRKDALNKVFPSIEALSKFYKRKIREFKVTPWMGWFIDSPVFTLG